RMECFEAAFHDTRSQCRPSPHRARDAPEVLCSEVLKLKQIAEQLSRAFGDDDRIRLGNTLQPGREIGCLAHDPALLSLARSNEVADNDNPGGNANARLQRNR